MASQPPQARPTRRDNGPLRTRPRPTARSNPTTMDKFRFRFRGAAALALAICAVAGGAAALGLPPPGSARTQQDPFEALPSHSDIAEGPGGRTQLTRWTLRKDRADQGLRLG